MRSTLIIGVLIASYAAIATAQQPDSLARRDSVLRADSIAAADSIRLVRELERIAGEPRQRDRGILQPVQTGPTPVVQGPANPTLLPNISAVGDVIFDLSPDGSTQETGERFTVREVELGIQAAVDPYFRADFFLGVHPDAFEIEEAYLSTLALPWQSQVRLGRFLLPFGKQNTTHRPELHTIEHALPVREFLGPEGAKGSGVWFSRIFAPFGFYQEFQAAIVEAFPGEAHAHGEEEEEHADEHAHEEEPELSASEPANQRLSGLGYVARLRNYWDLSEATNVEISGSFATGKRAVPLHCESDGLELSPCPDDVTAVNARQSLLGVDVTYRWRPLQEGLYKSLIIQGEWMRQVNHRAAAPTMPAGVTALVEGPRGSYGGAYLMARYQLTRRTYFGLRGDWLQEAEEAGEPATAGSAYLIFYPSEFSKMVAMFERVTPAHGEASNRLVLQTTFAVGPHRPHPF